jgi:hypothetical protein
MAKLSFGDKGVPKYNPPRRAGFGNESSKPISRGMGTAEAESV